MSPKCETLSKNHSLNQPVNLYMSLYSNPWILFVVPKTCARNIYSGVEHSAITAIRCLLKRSFFKRFDHLFILFFNVD